MTLRKTPWAYQSLAPPNATLFELAAEAALAETTEARAADPELFWNPQKCPVELLPWLAAAVRPLVWDARWPVAVKRGVLAATPETRAHLGTLYALRRGFEALGADVRVIEWWQTTPPGPHDTARIDYFLPPGLSPSGAHISKAAIDAAERLIQRVKPKRLTVATRVGGHLPATPALFGIGQSLVIKRSSSRLRPPSTGWKARPDVASFGSAAATVTVRGGVPPHGRGAAGQRILALGQSSARGVQSRVVDAPVSGRGRVRPQITALAASAVVAATRSVIAQPTPVAEGAAAAKNAIWAVGAAAAALPPPTRGIVVTALAPPAEPPNSESPVGDALAPPLLVLSGGGLRQIYLPLGATRLSEVYAGGLKVPQIWTSFENGVVTLGDTIPEGVPVEVFYYTRKI